MSRDNQMRIDFIKDCLRTEVKDGILTGSIKSEDTMKYMKEFHGLDTATIKTIISAETALTNDLLELGTQLLKDDKKADVVKLKIPITSKKRSEVKIVREKKSRNLQTGEEVVKPQFLVSHRVKSYMDRELIKELEAELKKK